MEYRNSIDYGQDAPGIRLGMYAAGVLGVLLFIAAVSALAIKPTFAPSIFATLTVVGAVLTIYGTFMGTYMTWASRVGKLKTRERLLLAAGKMRPWRGDETLLDAGCGRGLMLIGAAKLLPQGQAIGVDLWINKDQAANSAEATLDNAKREGVLDRVRIETGDIRQLNMPDSSVDAVVSHWVVHNLEAPLERQAALKELLRVLKPGGILILADIAYLSEYIQLLRQSGIEQTTLFDGGIEANIMGMLSFGSFRPQAVIGVKPE